MRRTGICTVALVICFCFALPSHAFFNSEVRQAKKFMAAQMYPQAIELLNKRINDTPTDEEAHFLLAECSLYIGNYHEASKRFDSALNLKPDLKEQAAQTCLKVAEGVKDINASAQIVMMAEQYTTNLETQKSIGQKELQLSRQCSGGLQQGLMQRAAQYLGHAAVYGFDKIKMSPNKLKIVFYTDQPVTVLEWKSGTTITYVEVSEGKPVYRVSYKDYSKSEPAMMNLPFRSEKTIPLVFRAEKGAYIILESEQF